MTWTTVFIFGFGMFVGASIISIVLGLCIMRGRAELEDEVFELRELLDRKKEQLHILQCQLADCREELR